MTNIQPQKTHREVKEPRISLRYLADYMAAENRHRAKNAILQKCRYQRLAQLYHHQEAKAGIRDYISGDSDLPTLSLKAQQLRERIDDTPYERNLYDYNADYLEAFVAGFETAALPKAEMLPVDTIPNASFSGVEVRFNPFAKFRRFMKGSNRERCGLMTLRYEKGKPLNEKIGMWQSAIMHGYQAKMLDTSDAPPEEKLTITYCVVSGNCFQAPTNSIDLFNEAVAACSTIAAAWEKLKPPSGAVI